MVKVVNDNIHPYNEKWRSTQISIPPKGFVKMDLHDAHLFLGTMPPNVERDGNGLQKATSYKMLRIERFAEGEDKPIELKKYICHACNADLLTSEAYFNHVQENHMAALTDDAAREAVVKRKPGRPAKGVTDDTSTDRNGSAAKV